MSIPAPDLAVPGAVRALARGAALRAVWRNGMGGVTFRSDDGRYIKYGPQQAETSMRAEAERMEWAHAFTRVPEVIESGEDDAHEWLVTRAIDGRSAVGEGLRALHEALPVADCPFDWSVRSRVSHAAARGIRLPVALQEGPPVDQLVVCHGDACCPNTLLGDDGGWLAHVDLGALGVGDRWADIAVAAMSTEWNYGPGWEDALIAAYGVAPDRDRLAYYRDLWNAT